MELNLILRFQFDDAATGKRRRFAKETKVQMPQVPRIGERVVITGEDRTNIGAHRVADVVYTPNNKVILDFELDGLINSAEQQAEVLGRTGFHEIGDAVELVD